MTPTASSLERCACRGAAVLLALAVLATASCRAAGRPPAPPEATGGAGPEAARRLSRPLLDRSLELGRRCALNSQTPEGNFVYEYDFVKGARAGTDNDSRQAGTLWTLALMHQDQPSEETARAIMRGLEFFRSHSARTEDGRRYVVYPGSTIGKTGAVALLALTLVEFLRADYEVPDRQVYEEELDEYARFICSLRTPDGHFYENYDLKLAVPAGGRSPFSDGEGLLFMVKAARYAGHAELRALALESAEQMYWDLFVQPVSGNPESPIVKGFYQWGSMAFYEIYTSGWPGAEAYAERAIEMAYSTIDQQRVLAEERNAASAYEGLAVAWELARLTGRQEAMDKIGRAIDAGLARFISWQVGGPTPNDYLRAHPTTDRLAVGGVMDGATNPVLRIDLTQHQMHATILARRFIYRE